MATALPLVNVTVRLVDQDGDPIIGAKVSAKLTTVERYQGYVIPEEYLGITDDHGTCIVRLFPNELGTEGSEYRFKISYSTTPVSGGKSLQSCHIGGTGCYSSGGKTLTVYASIPNADCNLEDVCDLDPYPIRGSGQILTEQVLSAAEAAKKAAQDVENIKPDIEAAKQAAITATTKASIAESAASIADLKADESASKAAESSSWASRAKAWAESPSIPDPNEPDSKSAKSWAEEAKSHNQQMPVTATGTTTPRIIADRFADVVNVKDFGAKGDGVTDDSSAITAAVVAAKTASARVFFPHGVYVTDSAVSDLSSVSLCGDGVIVADGNYYHVNNQGSHENVLYVSPDGTGDGLSVSRPTTLESAWTILQKVGFLSGEWKIKCAAGTYVINGLFKNVRLQAQSALTIEGAELTGDYKDPGSYSTKFTTSKKDPYSHILSFYSVTSVNLRYIFFEHSLEVDDGCCVVMAYDTVRCIISSCYLLNGTWCGVNFQSSGTAIVEGSVIDGGDKSRSTYGIEAYNCIVSTGPTKRNVIKNYAIGCHAQGRGYFHNDANDFINCDTGYSGGFQAHIEDNGNTYTGCNYNAIFRYGAGGSTASVSNGEKVMATFGTVSVKDNDAAQYWPGVFAYHLGTRGRMTLFDGRLNNSLFQRLCINLGDSDIDSSIAQYLGSQLVFYDRTNNTTNINYLCNTLRNSFYDITGNLVGYRQFTTLYGGQDTIKIGDASPFRVAATELGPGDDNKINAGNSARRYANIFVASGSISTSDERDKQDINAYSDAVLDAWGDVELRQFVFREAARKKGDAARIHAGVIAQQVVDVFKRHGLDATRYGLLCYDEWPDEYETVEVVDTPRVLDAEGNEVTPAQTHTERRLVTAAGDRYGIRYSEALCLEAAYQRRRADSLEQRITALEEAIKKS